MSAFLTFFDASDDRTADATFRLGDGEATRSMICNHGACFHIISTVITCNYLPVVPHKAVAEVSE
jgi:hypothetical protein